VLSALLVPLTIMLTANERFDMSTALNLMGQLLTIALGLLVLWMGLGIYALLLTGFVTMPFQILAGADPLSRSAPIVVRICSRQSAVWFDLACSHV
jgi:hypothetical protein